MSITAPITLRGLIRNPGRPGYFALLLPAATPVPGLAVLPAAAVTRFTRVGKHDGEDLIEVELEPGTGVRIWPHRDRGPLQVGGQRGAGPDRATGIPFILSTPHHMDAIRNPESMGGTQPVDPWRGPRQAPESKPTG